MLKSASQLKEDVSKAQAEEAKQKAIQDAINEKELKERVKKDIEKTTKRYLEEILPDLLVEAERKKRRQVIYPSGSNYAGEISLSFFNPKENHCKSILKKLKDLGYHAEVLTQERGNVEYVTTADGYDIIDADGTHEEHQMKVTW